uniref:Con-Ins Im2-like n=1 Tax=Crassostrea virginica TaxID=6565 RepID=A0A8B8AJF9_CRAVI|nr:con-Ins Im2-like [Crassostrea virginica]
MSAENTWIIISFCFFQLLCPVFGGFEKVCTFETYQRGVHAQGACGENLPTMLTLVCSDKIKRSGRSRQDKITDLWKLNSTLQEDTLQRSVLQQQNISPWKSMIKRMLASKEKALSFLSGKFDFSRSKKKKPGKDYGDVGIVCECCYHQCQISEFEDYCAK